MARGQFSAGSSGARAPLTVSREGGQGARTVSHTSTNRRCDVTEPCVCPDVAEAFTGSSTNAKLSTQQAAVPPFPRRHHVEVPGAVRVPRPLRAGARVRVARAPQPPGEAAGYQPFDHGSALHTDLWKPEWLKQALGLHDFDLASGAPGASRKSRGPRSGCSRSVRRSTGWISRRSDPSSGASTTPGGAPERASATSHSATGPSSTSGRTSTASRSRSCRLLRRGATHGRTRRHADHD